MIRIGIVGAKGYTAGELLRLLGGHPEAEVTCLMARVEAAEPAHHHFPFLRGEGVPPIEPMDTSILPDRCDLVFLALPHTVAQDYMAGLLESGLKVIDLSADFRFDSIELFEKTYGVDHKAPEWNERIPYALPELFRRELEGAPALANPGCYTTASILALAPLMQHPDELELDRIVINAMSGVSGAGRKPSETTHFPECNESVKAYSVGKHRHRPEIEEKLTRLAGWQVALTFTPHLVPMTRGILATCTIPLRRDLTADEVLRWYLDKYAGEPFVRVLPLGELPATAAVMMTNYCDIGLAVDAHSGVLIVVSAIDNLVKGASGQAIQNMNIMFGLPETMGLIARRAHEHV